MVYFDNAATTFPKPECVYDNMDKFYRSNGGSYGRGQHAQAQTAGNLVADTRARIKELLHCPAKQVIFTPSATIALNIIIQGIIKDNAKNIYISPFEHNAVTRTLYAYEKEGIINVTQLCVNDNLEYDLEKIRYQFDEVKPDAVIISHASNVIGLVAPVESVFECAKKYEAITIVDMAQTAGLIDCNIGIESFDFAVFAGHKTLYGPTGISGFVMKPDIKLSTTIYGGTGFESANQDMPGSLPERFEIGTLNIVGIAGLNAALKWIQGITVEKILNREEENRKILLDILGRYKFIKTVGIVEDKKYVGIVSCLINGISSDTAGNIFNENNVSVRAGLQCAPLAHKFLKTFPAGTVRFSVNYFTSNQDFDELVGALDYIESEL